MSIPVLTFFNNTGGVGKTSLVFHPVPGDLALAGFEDPLSSAWVDAMGSTQGNLSRPAQAYRKWTDRIPGTYRDSVTGSPPDAAVTPADDANCLARIRHYRSLVPMAQEVRKPIFHLTSADGAIGSHAQAVRDAWRDFQPWPRPSNDG